MTRAIEPQVPDPLRLSNMPYATVLQRMIPLRFRGFDSLKPRIALIYASLMAVTLGAVVVVADRGIDSFSERASRNEMAGDLRVFDEIRRIRVERLQDSARVLASDFGFRSAVATNDRATISSILQSVADRAGVEQAFVLGTDMSVSGFSGHGFPNGIDLKTSLENRQRYGVIAVNGMPTMAIAEPINAPTRIGWLILTQPLNHKELAGLAPGKLHVSVMFETRRSKDRKPDPSTKVSIVRRNGGEFLSTHIELPSLQRNARAWFAIERPLAASLAAYHDLKRLLAVIALLGVLIVTAVIPSLTDGHPCAHDRRPMDIMSQG